MADETYVCLFVTIFIIFWPHGSTFTVKDEKTWNHHCVSLEEHCVCSTKGFLSLDQRICRKTDLLEFSDWSFINKSVLLQVFPVDKETRNYVRQVHGVVFSIVHPVALKHKLHLVAISTEVITDILDLKTTSVLESPTFVEFVAGNIVVPNSVLLSHRYGGHQVRFNSKEYRPFDSVD